MAASTAFAAARVTKPAVRPDARALPDGVTRVRAPGSRAMGKAKRLPAWGSAAVGSGEGRPPARASARCASCARRRMAVEASLAAQQEPVDQPLHRTVGVDSLVADAADHVGGHGCRRRPDQRGQVDLLDDVPGDLDDVRAFDDRVQVDAGDDLVDIERVIDRLDLDKIVARVDIDPVIERANIVEIARYVVQELDLPALIRSSTASVSTRSSARSATRGSTPTARWSGSSTGS